MPREVDPYDHDVALWALRKIAANEEEPGACTIARDTLAVIEPRDEKGPPGDEPGGRADTDEQVPQF